jgi:hypothetical protein
MFGQPALLALNYYSGEDPMILLARVYINRAPLGKLEQ